MVAVSRAPWSRLARFMAIVSAVLAGSTLGRPASAVMPTLSYHGRWTPADSSQSYIAVHLALLRDTVHTTYHSKIIWWNDEDSGSVHGGLYGWNPNPTDTCGSFPDDSHFHPYSMPSSNFNMFCGGQTQLWHSDLLVAGGTEYGEVGITDSKFFHPTAEAWSDSGQMALPRWYPTVTALPDGRALVNGGTKYAYLLTYGGKSTGSAHATGNLRRLGLRLTNGGDWATPVNTSSRPISNPWPDSLEGATLTPDPPDGLELLFGGRDTSGTTYHRDMYIRYQEERSFGSDPGYYFLKMTDAGNNALNRADHTAVTVANSTSAFDHNNGIAVYGGRSGVSAKHDAWRFHVQTSGATDWRWDPVTLGSGGPGNGKGVYGHVAFFDAVHHRMLVYGGTDSTGRDPSDSQVYALDLTTPTGTCNWSTPPVFAPSGHPGPRVGAALAVDPRVLTRNSVPNSTNSIRTGSSAYIFGGQTKAQNDSTVTDSLWQLWVSSSAGCDTVEWVLLTPDSTTPAARSWGSAGYDAASKRIVFIGGTSARGSVGRDVFGLDLGDAVENKIPSSFHYHWQAVDSLNESAGISHAAVDVGADIITARVPEIATVTGTGSPPSWSSASPGDSIYHAEPWYPFMFVTPDGRVFEAGSGNEAGLGSALFNPSTKHWTPYPLNHFHQSTFYPGSAVMFRPGMVMAAGSRDQFYNADSQFGAVPWAEAIDLQADTAAAWLRTINDMKSLRLFHNLVILPDGDVLAVGGDSTEVGVDSTKAMNKACRQPEIWYPDTLDGSGHRGYWRFQTVGGDTLAPSHVERDYHSTALLLPDGRVLTAGGNAIKAEAIKTEIYCPPYLFTPSGARADRPKFHATNLPPDKVGYAQTFHIQTDSLTAIGMLDWVVLIKPGAVTHGFDEDQRFIRLPTAQCGLDSTILEVVAPINANIAPPGDYLMFLVYKNAPASGRYGTPSIARWIRVSSVSGTDGFSCPGGGGCPTVDTHGTTGWAAENTILSRSLTGTMATDALVLKNAPTAASGLATVRIRENENELTTLDRVRLAAVDHPSGTEVFASGEKISVGKRVPAYQVVTSTGVDITSKVSGAPGALGWLGNVTDTVYVQVSGPAASGSAGSHVGRGSRSVGIYSGDKDGPGGGGGASLRPTDGAKANRDLPWLTHTGIVIQVPDASGAWHDVAHQYPREQTGQAVLDSLGQDRFRMIFLGKHRLSFVGAIEQAGDVAPQMIAPLAAFHSRLGDVLRATLGVDSTRTYLVPGDTLTMSFAIPKPASGLVRDYVLVTHGVYTSNLTSTPGITPGPQLPLQFALHQNIPNPFGTTTSIHFDLPTASRVRVEVFDLFGRRIRTLTDAQWSAGFHQVEWDRRDMQGNLIRNGVFLYRMTAGSFTDHKKMVIVQ